MKQNLFVLYILTNFTLLWGQTNSSLQNEIAIQLTKGLSIKAVNGNLDFGSVLSIGSEQTLSKNPQYGVKFEVTGISRTKVSIEYSSNVVLSNFDYFQQNGGSQGNLSFTADVVETSGYSTYVSPKNIKSGRKIRLSSEGKLYLWVGGEISISENQPIGDYEGTFTITIAY